MKARQGFTLIELLVVISIIALLVAILLPALNKAREQAKLTQCRSSMHNIGLGLRVYEEDFDLKLPRQYIRMNGIPANDPARESYQWSKLGETTEPWQSYIVYDRDYRDGSNKPIPVQLAKLYEADYITTPEIFYCPSQRNREDNYVRQYTWEYYSREGPWGEHFPTRFDGTTDYLVRLNYNYWLHGESSFDKLQNKPVLFDFIYQWQVNNHVTHGAGSEPTGFNVMFGDGHVDYDTDSRLWDIPVLWGDYNPNTIVPGNFRKEFEVLLRILQRLSITPLSDYL